MTVIKTRGKKRNDENALVCRRILDRSDPSRPSYSGLRITIVPICRRHKWHSSRRPHQPSQAHHQQHEPPRISCRPYPRRVSNPDQSRHPISTRRFWISIDALDASTKSVLHSHDRPEKGARPVGTLGNPPSDFWVKDNGRREEGFTTLLEGGDVAGILHTTARDQPAAPGYLRKRPPYHAILAGHWLPSSGRKGWYRRLGSRGWTCPRNIASGSGGLGVWLVGG
ncbi:hypothetical protein K505DRAFT_74852 [Melanomma pulvis-pyrius CBS 109.77]|uniref:Uncharacterized protein n=1 Tax=Melanomma pulvis-pyrius CBS 109.77 TaxID=1314802 RepID=A0A6A6X3R4_9PLEO|nr:hypothetical protein K505DRAFT_74852 [Melanomma pulvis-pyrius CBS 109.77]